MRLPKALHSHPANTPVAVRAVELSEENARRSEVLLESHEAHLRGLYSRLYPDTNEPLAVLRRIRDRRGLKQTL
jgi:hypothetical protein